MSVQTKVKIPDRARVVIIGGGIIGCSVAYHLTKLGWSDVVLLERRQLTCGTTWHSAGQVGQLRPSYNLTKLSQYTASLLPELEQETGQATGFRKVGSIGFATTEGRWEELRRVASMAKSVGVSASLVTPDEISDLWPIINNEGILGGIYTPDDGYTNPVDTTIALAKGAKQGGAQILEHVEVTEICKSNDQITGVKTNLGDIRAEYVVNCGGMWGKEIGQMAGVNVPLQACEHYYMVTDLDEWFEISPSARDWDAHVYFKSEPGKLLFGFFEHEAKPWALDGIPREFCFDELPAELEHAMPYFEAAIKRVPILEQVGIQKFFNGPESFTPDVRFHLGEAPEVKNFYVACGFNSIGVLSSGGAGKALAEWIVEGRPGMDLSDVDIRRMQAFQTNRNYLADRVSESLGLLYATHWPFRQPETARGVRRSPLHHRLKELGACFGEVAGWERANWYAPKGEKAEYEYSFGRQNWFEFSRDEHLAIRENVGIIDLSSFAKFQIKGRDAEAVLQKICCADMAVPVGRIVYTQWLNERGGIEADVTISRKSLDEFLIITGAANAVRDKDWLQKNIPDDAHCFVADLSSGIATIGVMGPQSRALLGSVTPAELDNENFSFGTAREIEFGCARIWAMRISYVGELGWELHVPTEFAVHVFDTLMKANEKFDGRLVGMHAVDSCRIEKAYRHWGHDITDEDTPLEAGLGFCCAMDKEGQFTGQEAISAQKKHGPDKRLVQFLLDDPDPLIYHHEPIYRNNELVGYITSGAYGHYLGRSIGLGYISIPQGSGSLKSYIDDGNFELEIASQRYSAQVTLRPAYDPANERMKL